MIPIDTSGVHYVLLFFFSRRLAQHDSSTSRTSTLDIDTNSYVGASVSFDQLYLKQKERHIDYAIIEEALNTFSDQKKTLFRLQSYLT